MKKSYLAAIAASGMFGILSCADPAAHQGDNLENTPDEVNPMPMTDTSARDTLSEDSLNPMMETPTNP
ncbi:hypothetical protein [Sphingobacterium corticibacter]|uniref:Uncharacterized protein n=1 Tax=Sphingobacterium corticibacter TaxID=2171749 RepID=A0A2T8HL79_9SPHI|nr:hypothetical protein [Sphingobacterium corticibacter]PVH26165.1 hypothetical protein DC487_00625 [Sphingobacterium corticibacter]